MSFAFITVTSVVTFVARHARKMAFALLLSVTGLASGTLPPANEVEHWALTKVNRTFVRQFLSNELCAKRKELTEACRKALVRLSSSEKDESYSRLAMDAALDQVESRVEPTRRAFVYGQMINEVLRQFDAHAKLMPESMFEDLIGGKASQRVDPGISWSVTSRGVFVRSVVQGSDADKVGIRPLDRLEAIDGQVVTHGVGAWSQLKALSGRPGAYVIVKLQRGSQTMERILQLQRWSRPVSQVSVLSIHGRNLGVIEVSAFSKGLCEEIRNQMSTLAQDQVTGLVLDLRDNLGGFTAAAECVFGLLAGQLPMFSHHPVESAIPKEFSLPAATWHRRDGQGEGRVLWRGSLAVLINARSASASEMLAAALQDHGLAWIVGERSFGKGTSQAITAIGSGLTIFRTISMFYRPNQTPIQHRGVQPDLDVSFVPGEVAREAQIFNVGSITAPSGPDLNPSSRLDSTCAERVRPTVERWYQQQFRFIDPQAVAALSALYCPRPRT